MRDKTHLRNGLTMVTLLLLLIVPAFAGRVIYVDADANGLNDGSSWWMVTFESKFVSHSAYHSRGHLGRCET
jgi:hypothetical protein